jgi:hypothetical protein
MAIKMPAVSQHESELGPVLKTVYAPRLDQYSLKFGKGHRTYSMVKGRRPATRTARRAQRPL